MVNAHHLKKTAIYRPMQSFDFDKIWYSAKSFSQQHSLQKF